REEKEEEVSRAQRGEIVEKDDETDSGKVMRSSKPEERVKKGGKFHGHARDDQSTGTADLQIFVGNIGAKVTLDDLKREFQQFGKVVSAKILVDRDTKKPNGKGFVTFSKAESVIEAVKWDGRGKDGRDLKIQPMMVERKIFVRIPRPYEARRGGKRGGAGQMRQLVTEEMDVETSVSEEPDSDISASESGNSMEFAHLFRGRTEWSDDRIEEVDVVNNSYETESEGFVSAEEDLSEENSELSKDYSKAYLSSADGRKKNTDLRYSNASKIFWGYVDSGCSSHIVPSRKYLRDVRKMTPKPFQVADGNIIESTGEYGKLTGNSSTGGYVSLNKVHVVPEADAALLSVWQLNAEGYDTYPVRLANKPD
ncbi:hypothetical protein HDU96_002331, partial [Phlyctochytrium bullatum]